jgi:hypothetical protein
VLPSAATSILLHRDSGLLAVICDDLVVRIVDIETRRIVRELKGFRGRILDVVRDSTFGSNFIDFSRSRVDFLSGLPLAGHSVARLHHPHV